MRNKMIWMDKRILKKIERFRLVLSPFGKEVFKGGNIEVMEPNLKEYNSLKEIDNRYLNIGASKTLYDLEVHYKEKWIKIFY